MIKCSKCGKEAAGAYTEGGLKWSICDECMDMEARPDKREETIKKLN